MQDCIIEIPKNSYVKYEIEKGKLLVDRILSTPIPFPFNYGYIPNTLAGDGDPLDILVLSDYELVPGCSVKCKILGYLDMEDEKGIDEKIISVISSDYNYNNCNKLSDLTEKSLHDIKYFFEHYKDNEPNKFSKVGQFYDKEKALELISKTKIVVENNIVNV